jgi:hypothetical protein
LNRPFSSNTLRPNPSTRYEQIESSDVSRCGCDVRCRAFHQGIRCRVRGWIGENHRIQIRAEAFNVLNRQVPFYSADLDVNSTSFGRITSSYNTPRIIQFGIRYDF